MITTRHYLPELQFKYFESDTENEIGYGCLIQYKGIVLTGL